MNVTQTFLMAVKSVLSNKIRSLLPMLGIIIGIAAIIAIVSTIKGTNEQIKENLIGSGENTVNVRLYQGDNTYEIDYNGVPDGVPVITEETRTKMLDLKHVARLSIRREKHTMSSIIRIPGCPAERFTELIKII